MWKAAVGHNVAVKEESQGDDWDTDPDFVNDISEKDQRWGAKTIEGSGRAEHINIHQLRSKVSEEHEVIKKKELEIGPKASYGYGGKFGTEQDRMDKSALGHEYVADVEKHSSQTDAAKGFGGKYGVQRDRADKSALGFEYKGEVEKHSSQKDYAKGFGGRYGVEKDKLDKAAVGFDYKSQTEKHESQKDYAVGFGGKFGVQKDRQDKCALGWEHQEELKHHESQTDYVKGFGGRYGVQEDRVDKSTAGFNEMEAPTSSYEKTKPVEAASSGARSLKSRFESMAKSADEENRKRVEEERVRRQAREQREHQAAQQQQQKQQETQETEEANRNKPGPTPALEPRRVCKEPAMLPSPQRQQARSGTGLGRGQQQLSGQMPEAQQEADVQDEEQPPALPPRPSDLGEGSSKLHEEEAIYADSVDLQGDYEELPEPSDDNDGADVSRDYEELPEPSRESEAIYDEGVDTSEDYEEIPPESASSSIRNIPCPVCENVYEADDAGISAVALYDYQGEGDDEISFDPNDTITHIEIVDEGWWRGHCHGRVGLFPANYVKLLQ